MAKGRLLATVGVKANKDEFVYYKDGKLYAVKRKSGGTKGAKRKSCKKKTTSTKKKSAPKTKSPAKKAAVKKSATAPRIAIPVVKTSKNPNVPASYPRAYHLLFNYHDARKTLIARLLKVPAYSKRSIFSGKPGLSDKGEAIIKKFDRKYHGIQRRGASEINKEYEAQSKGKKYP